MKNNCNQIKQTCGTTNFATCISFEGTPNNNSPLKEDCQLSVEEVLDDVYTQLEQINLSELGERCLDYVLEDNKIIVKNVLLKYEEEICTLKQQVEDLQTISLCEQDLTACDLDFGTLVNSCGEVPSDFKSVIQLILDTIQP